MTTLRNKLIRLAYTNPDLRPHLLPVLASSPSDVFHRRWDATWRLFVTRLRVALGRIDPRAKFVDRGPDWHYLRVEGRPGIRSGMGDFDHIQLEMYEKGNRMEVYLIADEKKVALAKTTYPDDSDKAFKEVAKRVIQESLKAYAAIYRASLKEDTGAPSGAKGPSIDENSFRGISLGRHQSVRRVERNADGSWSIEPSQRQRLDHYVGSGYDPGEGGDPEGWDQDGWEEEYAGPMREAAEKWLAQNYGKGLFILDVGDKGYLTIQLTSAGKKHFGSN